MEIQNKYMNVKLVSKTEGAGEFQGKSLEDMIVYKARVSSSRANKFDSPAGLINYCIKNKHWSIFEHGFITMEIVTSKAIGIQLLRHRSFTFQEFSQRYATVSKFEPIELREQHANNRQSSTDVFNPAIILERNGDEIIDASSASVEIEKAMSQLQWLYNSLLEAGVARECARMVLPMATQTTIYMTGPVRSWIHLINIRDDSHAQKEAQLIAREMKRIFMEQCPIISEALGWLMK